MEAEKLISHPVVAEMVAEAGAVSQAFGLGKNPGRVYAYLFFSEQPRSLADIQDALQISKGSTSMVARQLEQWEAIYKVDVDGDRRDYYAANDWLGRLFKNMLTDTVGQRLAVVDAALTTAAASVEGDCDATFLQDRIAHLRRFSSRSATLWNNPLVRRVLS